MGTAADRLIAIDGAGSNDADGRFVLFHHANWVLEVWERRSIFFVDVEGVLHIAGGMVGRKVQSFVVVIVVVDVGAVLNGKSHADQRSRELRPSFVSADVLCREAAAAGKGDVDFFYIEALGLFDLGKLKRACSQSWAISSLRG